MPIYEFRCKKCNALVEVFQKLSDKPPSKCRKCGGRLEKLFSRPAIQFKGEGWYVTDYARKGSAGEKAEKEAAAPESTPTTEKAKPAKAPAKESPSE